MHENLPPTEATDYFLRKLKNHVMENYPFFKQFSNRSQCNSIQGSNWMLLLLIFFFELEEVLLRRLFNYISRNK